MIFYLLRLLEKVVGNIIFLTLDLVYPDDTGGRKLSLGRILHEQKKGHNVTVIHYNYKKQIENEAICFFKEKNISFYSFSPSDNQHGFYRLIGYIKSCINRMPEPYYLINNDKDFKRFLEVILQEVGPSLVSLESIFFASVNNVVQAKGTKVNYTLHNVESDFYFSLYKSETRKIKKTHYYIQALLLKILEKEIFNSAGDVSYTFLSREDLNEYQKRYAINHNNCMINHNDINIIKIIERKINIDEPFFLFAGSLDFPANSFAIRKLLKAPGVNWDNIPKIVITGSVSEKTREEFSNFSNIDLVGRISESDLYELFSTCIASISPILTGGGIKIKNLETIKLGVPLIATRFSCIGLDINSDKIILSEDDSVCFYNAMLGYYNKVFNCEIKSG